MQQLRPILIAAALMLTPHPAAAQSETPESGELYKAETIVTGTGEAERLRGFGIGAEDVLVKLTGEARFAGTKRAKSLAEQAAALVAEHSYEDRMKDIPIHDEQGTRDRPHYLRMRFDPDKFDEALKKAGFKKWEGPRPTLAVWIGIREPRGKYVLSHDGGEGYGQREVLKDASKKRGIPILLPPEKQDAVTFDAIAKSDWPAIRRASKELGRNDAVLYGTLEFDGNAYWNTRWVVAGDGAYAKWRMNGVTFDAALKGAIDQVAAAHAKRANRD